MFTWVFLLAYKKSLEEDLAVDTGNVFKQMLLQLVKAQIDESRAVDQTIAEEDARKIFKVILCRRYIL